MYYKHIINDTYFDVFRKRFINSKDINPILKNLNFYTFNKVLEKRTTNTLVLIFTITTKCNLTCSYCFQNSCNRKNMNLKIEKKYFK